jgi:nicotinamide mononucleotide transporter
MMRIIEIAGVISGLLYLYLEIKQKKSMWIVGFATSLLYVFVFFFSKLYADMGLQVYYLIISIYGFMRWNKETEPKENSEDSITYHIATLKEMTCIILSMIALTAILYYPLKTFTDSPIPLGDSITTSVGIIATWMVARKYIENWIFWILVNLLSVYIYFTRGLYPTMILYICNATLAYIGYMNWKKKGTRI